MGCPHTCSFCNQRTISSTAAAPAPEETDKMLKEAFSRIPAERHSDTEIAFFGGSFTAIDREYMTALLSAAAKYVFCEGGFGGIRISTRPDCIDEEILILLKSYGVTSIELGAQSMSDRVLELNERGHTADDVRKSARLIKEHGFETGLQMMVGLYGSTVEDEMLTMREIADCSPDTVRIYPTVILDGTHLGELYRKGLYKTFSFEECVSLCGDMLCYFHNRNIRVIRLGLHAENGVENNAIGGFYHPAFAQLVRSELFMRAILRALKSNSPEKLEIAVCGKNTDCAVGHKKSNRKRLTEMGIPFSFSVDNSLTEDEISINKEVYNVFKITGDARL